MVGAASVAFGGVLRGCGLFGAACVLGQVGVVRVCAAVHRLVGGVIAADDAGKFGNPEGRAAKVRGGRIARCETCDYALEEVASVAACKF